MTLVNALLHGVRYFELTDFFLDSRETAMTYLFTKQGCGECEMVKNQVNLETIDDLEVMQLDHENVEALAMLAYYECVALSEKKLPILVSETSGVITGAGHITNYLRQLGA